jgi:hypothetical protein
MSALNHRESTDVCDLAAGGLVILWYCIVYFAVRPLTEAPVIDSWVYEHAVAHFNQSGRIQFAGYTQATPVLQVLYGAAWSHLFGATSRSLDLSTALLGIIGGLLFYRLARRSGAVPWTSAAATALVICNPCYLFLSFAFMTEVPFLLTLIVSYAAFAQRASSRIWLWVAALAAAAGFAIRPFALATIAGEVIVLFMDRPHGKQPAQVVSSAALVPFIVSIAACAAGYWLWMTMLTPKPWMLQYHEYLIRNYFGLIPLRAYLDRGVLQPAIYLGLLLSPLALLHTARNWRTMAIGVAILTVSIVVTRLEHEGVWNLEQFACFGGSHEALVLSAATAPPALPPWLGWIFVAVGAAGFAGICAAIWDIIAQRNRTVMATLLAAAIYWAAMPFLWFFGDRYDLLLIPAACLALAVSPVPRRPMAVGAAALMTAVLALVSLSGLVSYHCSMQRIVMETDALLHQGIARKQIDAGYSLNGRDLYVYPAEGIDTARDEPPIPLITSRITLPYIISSSPAPNTVIWRRFSGCGPSGFGQRPLFVLKSNVRSSFAVGPMPGKTRRSR